MSDPVLAAIQARVDAAVEGPWFFDGYCRVQSGPRLDAYNQWDADTPADLAEDDPRWDAEPETIMAKTQNITSAAKDGKPHGDLGTVEGIANGEFIAHARTDIPLLLAALSEARSQALEEAAQAIEAAERVRLTPVYEQCEPLDGNGLNGTWGCEPWASCHGQHYNGVSGSHTTPEEYAAIVRALAGTETQA